MVTQPQTKPPTSDLELSNPPFTVSVEKAYIGNNHRHIVADPGDQVAVFAWNNNRTQAIAYNLRNKSSGCIPANHLQRVPSAPVTDAKLYMTKSALSPHGEVDHVKWNAGDHIWVWGRQDQSHSRTVGLCLS